MQSQAPRSIRLIVGLGNPGREYAETRHNIGFRALACLAAQLPGRWESSGGCRSELLRGRWRGRTLWLQWPQTWMNLSGEAVLGLARREKIAPEEILVVSDDLDLPLGRLRLRASGSDGGHNGLKSVIAELGSSDFARLRIGIGRSGQGSGKAVIDHVLSVFDAEELPAVAGAIEQAAEAAKMVLARGIGPAMNKFNGKARDNAPDESKPKEG